MEVHDGICSHFVHIHVESFFVLWLHNFCVGRRQGSSRESNTALLSIKAVIYKVDLEHGESFYFSKPPINCNVKDVEPISSGVTFINVVSWVVYD